MTVALICCMAGIVSWKIDKLTMHPSSNLPSQMRLHLQSPFLFGIKTGLILFCLMPLSLRAQSNQTWTNSAGTLLWNLSDTNWSGTAWTNNNNAIFGSTGAGSITANGVVVNDMTFNTAGYSISGSLTLANDAGSTITNNVSALISANISNGSGGASVLTKTGSGVLTLTGNNTYSLATIVGQGTLSVSSIANGGVASSIGASSSSDFALQLKNGATLLYTGTGSTTNRSMMIDYSGTIDASGSGALKFNNASGVLSTNTGAAANTSRTITLTGTNAGDNTMALRIGNPTGSGSPVTSLAKSGSGQWIITGGTNTYSGGTTISAGTLLVNNTSGSGLGSGAVTVNGGTFGGTGAFAGAITVGSGANLHSGGIESIETLGSGALTMNNNSTFGYEINSSVTVSVGADLQKVTGSLNLVGTVTLTLNDLATTPVAFAQGTKFTLVNYTGVWNGGFFTVNGNTVADGDLFTVGLNTWIIDYDALTGGSNFSGEFASDSNFVNITAVPEPGTLALFCIGAGVIIFKRKRCIPCGA